MSSRSPNWGSFAGVMGICLAAGAVAGGVSAYLDDVDGPAGLLGTMTVVAAALAVGFYVCMGWWRRLDEAAREAHKWAWFWGGSGGMSSGLIILIAVQFRSDPAASGPLSDMPATEALYNGAMFMVLSQAVGYAIAWAVWWLRHR